MHGHQKHSFVDRVIIASTLRPKLTAAASLFIALIMIPGMIGFDRFPLLNRVSWLRGVGGIVQDTFGESVSDIFMSIEADSIFHRGTLEHVERVHRRIESIPDVTGVSSIITLEDATGIGDEIRTASIGVLFSIVVAITFIPALLTFLPIPKPSPTRREFSDRFFDRIVDRVNRFTVRRSRPIFAVGLALIAAGAVRTVFVSNDISSTDYFVSEHRIRFLTRYFSANFDGVETMTVVINLAPDLEGSAKNAISRRLAEIEEGSETLIDAFSPRRGDTSNEITDPVASQADSAETADDPFGTDPFAAQAVSLDAGGSLADISIEELDSRSNRGAVLNVATLKKVEDLVRFAESQLGVGEAFSTGDGKRLRSALSGYMKERFDSDGIYYLISGGSITLMTIQDYVVSGQILSIVISVIAIALITSIVFGSLKMGPLSIIPLTAAVVLNFGVMGIFGIKLNIATALISSFVIGIGIDDTIHYLLNLKKELVARVAASAQAGPGGGLPMATPGRSAFSDAALKKEIIYHALKRTSKAIVFTTLALVFGFTVVGFSSFLPVKNFSILVALTMVNATLATLLFLPSVITIFPGLLRPALRTRRLRERSRGVRTAGPLVTARASVAEKA